MNKKKIAKWIGIIAIETLIGIGLMALTGFQDPPPHTLERLSESIMLGAYMIGCFCTNAAILITTDIL